MVVKQDWRYKGSECCTPVSSCCLSCWCPCIIFGRTAHRRKNQGSLDTHSAFNGSCLAFCGLSCLGISFVLPMLSRGDMRAKYQLKGNACADCLCACCCQPCDLTQQDKEAQYREEQNKPMLAQPGKEGGMMYQAQQQQPQFHHG